METDLRLESQLCFALYAASRSVTTAYREALSELGLTYPQYLTLLALWENDGESVSALGARLHLDSGTLSPLLKRLAAAGLVDRRRNTEDERKVTVHLTPRGAALREHAEQVQLRALSSIDLSPTELDTLRTLARRLCASVATEQNPPEAHPATQGEK